jgi:cytochrome P450
MRWLGATVELLRNPLAYLRAAHRELGPVFEVRAAHRRFVVLAGQEANRFVGHEGRDALESWSFWGRLAQWRECPHMILALDGEAHRTLRGHYGDSLSRRFVDERRAGCDDLVRDGFGRGMGSIPVQDQTRLLVARLVHHCMTGARAIPEPTARALLEVFRWETNTLLLGKWPKLALYLPAYRRSLAVAEQFLDDLGAREARDGWFDKVNRGRVMHSALFQDGDVRFARLLPFVAGVDTVGSTLGFVLDELHRDGALYARVAAEVEEIYRGGVPDCATLSTTTALRGLVLECLRLYPAAFASYRGAARDFEFAGRTVTRGTHVAVFTSATHFDERYWTAPEQLDVDRHAPPRSESRQQKHIFMPYGAGPHVCLGAGMGEALLLLATAAIVRHHPLRMPAGAPRRSPVFDPSLTLDPRVLLERV